MGNPYLNTYNSGWQHHPSFSWNTNLNAPQPPQEKRLNLEDVMAQLAKAQAEFAQFMNEMSQPPHEEMTNLEETMAELVRSQIEMHESQTQFVDETSNFPNSVITTQELGCANGANGQDTFRRTTREFA